MEPVHHHNAKRSTCQETFRAYKAAIFLDSGVANTEVETEAKSTRAFLPFKPPHPACNSLMMAELRMRQSSACGRAPHAAELVWLTAADQQAAMAAGEVTAVELCTLYLQARP